jgi:hypothetical protein
MAELDGIAPQNVEIAKGIPDKQRVAVLMVGVDGVSYERASEHLKVPVGTIKSRVSRGRDALRLAMEGKESRRFRPAVPKSAEALERRRSPGLWDRGSDVVLGDRGGMNA